MSVTIDRLKAENERLRAELHLADRVAVSGVRYAHYRGSEYVRQAVIMAYVEYAKASGRPPIDPEWYKFEDLITAPGAEGKA